MPRTLIFVLAALLLVGCPSDDDDAPGLNFAPPARWSTCLEALDEDPSLEDGVYLVDTDGEDGPLQPIEVFCNMTISGGGWTRILRTSDDFSTNLELFTGYTELYEQDVPSPDEDGLARVSAQHWVNLSAQGDVLVRHELKTDLGSACDPLWYSLNNGSMNVAAPGSGDTTYYSFSGENAHHVVNGTNIAFLSTADFGPNPTCINDNGRAPWFYRQGCGANAATIGYFGSGRHQPAVQLQALGGAGPDLFDRTEVETCGIEALATPPNAPPEQGWVAEVSQETYFR